MLHLLQPIAGFSLLSLLLYVIAKAVVRTQHLGQLYADTPVILRHINSLLLFILIPVHILYLAIVYSIHYNKQFYVDNLFVFDVFIAITVIGHGIVAVFLDQGLGYVFMEIIFFILSILFTSRNAHLYILLISLSLTILKCVRSNTPPVPILITRGDLPIKFKELEQDYRQSGPSNLVLLQPQQHRLYRPKYEGVQLKRPS
jgi:hypothetical protein